MHKYDTKIQNCHSFDKINSKTIWKSLKINKALVLERCFFLYHSRTITIASRPNSNPNDVKMRRYN